MSNQPSPDPGAAPLTGGIRFPVAVGSGKGGVGKSTVSVNLAVALAQAGARVGLMDADIYGPNVPMMMAVREPPQVIDNRIVPVQAYGVKMISMGFFLKEEEPVVWRGPMVHGAIRQFLGDVDWGDLDFLLIDLPPGTGDTQLSLSQMIPLTGAVIVTTPQSVSLADARKAMSMFEKVRVPILGVIENMSFFICPTCEARHDIFAADGGKGLAQRLGLNSLGQIPLYIGVRQGGDDGYPVVLKEPESPPGKLFIEAAGRLREICESGSPSQAQKRQSVVFQPTKE